MPIEADKIKRIVRVGSRASRLAVAQAEIVMRQIESVYPGVQTELVTMKTTGDKILDKTLDQIGGKGLFVKELDEALRSGDVDITVHSLKDLPKDVPDDIPVIAYSKREDPRDVLILPEGTEEIDMDLPAGTSSLRRSLQIKELIPGIETAPVRGNVETRLRKLDEGQCSCLIMASAGLIRLGLENRISRYFETAEMIPAPCQGILAIQARAADDFIANRIIPKINDKDAEICATAEREFVRVIGADCGSPDTAHAWLENRKLHMLGLVYCTADGTAHREAIEGSPSQPELLGRRRAEELMRSANANK